VGTRATGLEVRSALAMVWAWAETGADMTRFLTAGHLASWAGVCPGHHESAGRVKSTKTRPGNPYLKAVLGTAAMNAARNRDTYLGARYRRIAARRGKSKATVAVQHSILVAIWNMAQTGALYDDPGADYYTRIRPAQTKNRASANSKRWATSSPSTARADPRPSPSRQSSSQVQVASNAATSSGNNQQRRIRPPSMS
jgi:hypothetical protein